MGGAAFRTVLLMAFILSLLSFACPVVKAQNQFFTSTSDSLQLSGLLQRSRSLARTNPDSAHWYANQVLARAREIHSPPFIYGAILVQGNLDFDQGNYENAFQIWENGRREMQKMGAAAEAANFLIELGTAHRKQSEYRKALFYFLDAKHEFEAQGMEAELSKVYNNLGLVYHRLYQFDQALEYYHQSLKFNLAEGRQTPISVLYNNISSTFTEMGELDSALIYLHKAKDIRIAQGDQKGIALILNNEGLLYTKHQKYAEAENSIGQAIELARKLKDSPLEATFLINQGFNYLEWKQPEKSIEYGLRGMKMARLNHQKHEEAESCQNLAQAYALKGDYARAYPYLEKYIGLKDNILPRDLAARVAEEEARLEKEKQENEIRILEYQEEISSMALASEKRLNWAMTGGIGLLLVIALLLYARYRTKQRTNEQLKEADRMKSRYFANISHEFKTPLTLILGPLDTLLQEENTDQATTESLRRMQRSARHLLDLNLQLLDLSRLESKKMGLKTENGDLVSTLREMALSFQSMASQRKINFQLHLPEAPLQAVFDRDKLERIVNNLLSNAFKYTPDGREVRFYLHSPARYQPKEKENLPSNLLPANSYEIRVEDDGQGIAHDDLNRIFDRFFRVDATRNSLQSGTGIGLALLAEIVELLEGRVWVESSENEGSSFTVRLPLKSELLVKNLQEVSQDAPETQAREAVSTPGKEHQAAPVPENHDQPLLLIAEDHAELRAYIRDTFAGKYQVLEAENGKVGLELAIQRVPDLIISDLMMPFLDGMEFCQKVKTNEKTSHIPFVLLTAVSTVESRLEGLETGADDYLNKPFNAQELQARVKNLIAQRARLREKFSRPNLAQPAEITVTSVDEKFLQKLFATIEENISDPELNVEFLGEEMSMSKAQFYRKVKAITDLSPVELIRNIRMKRAAQLLRKNFGNVADTMYEVGFSNSSYFAKCFKQQFGVAPSEYVEEG